MCTFWLYPIGLAVGILVLTIALIVFVGMGKK